MLIVEYHKITVSSGTGQTNHNQSCQTDLSEIFVISEFSEKMKLCSFTG